MAYRQHKLFYGSSYDRGLEHLLKMWPDILAKFPDATLDVCYGWDLFDRVAVNNAERMKWKETMVELLKQPGITDHGRVSKNELSRIRKECGIWAYPTHFTEINCITALEAQRDGLVPVTMNFAALKETVGSGVKVEGDIYDKEIQQRYLEYLFYYMAEQHRWESESRLAQEFAKDYDWSKIAHKWTDVFNQKASEDIKVTIYTPTIRKGFWNLMGNNIALQTYKNIEWIIVDDFPTDRSEIANRVAFEYNLDIRYLRGKKRSVKRNYGLVNANNTALENATGELLVLLQDFVLMPLDGIEQLVLLHEKNPTSLIAPCDIYVEPKIKPDIDSEDWFAGEVDVIGKFMRKNVRIQNKGIRLTDNAYDFEQNYGAIPVKVAKELGGWYEYYDFGLGYDNTDIAFRAMCAGFPVIVDETNVATCIDHWEALKGTRENVIGRARKLNDPLFVFSEEMIKAGKLPIKRTQEVDDKINLSYDIPDSVDDLDVVKWVNENAPAIVEQWIREVKI